RGVLHKIPVLFNDVDGDSPLCPSETPASDSGSPKKEPSNLVHHRSVEGGIFPFLARLRGRGIGHTLSHSRLIRQCAPAPNVDGRAPIGPRRPPATPIPAGQL